MAIVHLDTGQGEGGDASEAEQIDELRRRSAAALEGAWGFLKAQDDHWARLRAEVLCEALGRAPRGTGTVERVRMLERAVAAFARIERDYEAHREIVAEASFRRGQMLGRLGRPDEAQQAFERSAGLSGKRWAARALYEAGNAQRRSKRWTKALACYRKAMSAQDVRYATKAWLAVGKALLRLGRVPEARAELEKLAKDPGRDAFERVRAFDELASTYLSEKRLDLAREVLAQADAALTAQSAGEDKRSASLRRSLQRMRSRKKLARIEGEHRK